MRKSVFLVFLFASMLVSQAGWSYGGRSGGSSSSFSSSSRSSGSFSGRSSSSYSSGRSSSWGSSSSSRSSSSWGSSSKSSTGSYSSTPKSTSGFGSSGARGSSATKLYESFRSKNTSPIMSNSKLDTRQIDKVFSRDYRQSRRRDYYSTYTPAPAYNRYVTTHSSYGPWDALLMWSILDNASDRDMYYHHSDSPYFQSWRSDANSLCAQGDQAVCAKLRDLDYYVAQQRNAGVVKDPSYTTPGIDPDIYEANNIDPSTLPELKICTGSLGSDYNRFAGEMQKVTKLKIKSIQTNGSVDNLAKMATGECDLSFVQDDTVTPSLKKILTLDILEVMVLACKTPLDDYTLKDFASQKTIYVGSDQTGSNFTLQNTLQKIVKNNAFKNLPVDDKKPALAAANDFANDKLITGCFFSVTTPDSPLIKALDQPGVRLIPIMSFDLERSYPKDQMVIVKGDRFKYLQQKEYTGAEGEVVKVSGTDTLAVKTSLVASDAWISQNQQLFDVLMLESKNLKASLR